MGPVPAFQGGPQAAASPPYRPRGQEDPPDGVNLVRMANMALLVPPSLAGAPATLPGSLLALLGSSRGAAPPSPIYPGTIPPDHRLPQKVVIFRVFGHFQVPARNGGNGDLPGNCSQRSPFPRCHGKGLPWPPESARMAPFGPFRPPRVLVLTHDPCGLVFPMKPVSGRLETCTPGTPGRSGKEVKRAKEGQKCLPW